MPDADKILRRTVRRLVVVQLALLGVAAGVILLAWGLDATVALLYGGAVTIGSTLLGAWRMRVAAAVPNEAVALHAAELYKSAVFKLLTAVALLVLGIGVLELAPLPLLVGLAVTQVGYLLTRGYAE